jgi:8-oxo-dGTP pyrophosphatase MutT (NUDIX family)
MAQGKSGRARQSEFSRIARSLAARQPVRITDVEAARAGVAMVLREGDEDTEILFIQRAIREGDPWSGHMAFPGGRHQPADPDVVHTALRETREEVGIDLFAAGEVIGRLDELRAVARQRPLDLVITPVVCALRRPVALALDAREVESALWIPLSFFRQPEARAVHRRALDGIDLDYPAYRYERYTVWGMTHYILDRFLELIDDQDSLAIEDRGRMR